MKKLFVLFFCACSFFLFAEDGFGFDDEAESESRNVFNVEMGGNIASGFKFFLGELKDLKKASAGFPFESAFYLEATAPLTRAFFKVRLSDKTLPINLGNKPVVFPKPLLPFWLDEGFLEVSAGKVVFGGGIRKLYWGRVPYFSVLDVVNPLDLSDPTECGTEKIKIAVPMFFLYAYLPKDMKLEFTVLPMFEGHRLAVDDKFNSFHPEFPLLNFTSVKTHTLYYAQGGVRYTAQAGGIHDVGVQYFCRLLPLAAFKTGSIDYRYDRCHQLGVDYGVQIGSTASFKTEFAANITHDVRGKDPYAYNPYLEWTAGFDFSMIRNIGLQLYVSEILRFFQYGDKKDLLSSGLDKTLGGTDTRLAVSIRQKLLRGSLEWCFSVLSSVEDADFLITPELHWIAGSLLIDVKAGFFGGSKNGKLGRHKKRNFLKLSLGYEF